MCCNEDHDLPCDFLWLSVEDQHCAMRNTVKCVFQSELILSSGAAIGGGGEGVKFYPLSDPGAHFLFELCSTATFQGQIQ